MTYMKHQKDLYSVLDKDTGKWKFQKEGWKPGKNDVDHKVQTHKTHT